MVDPDESVARLISTLAGGQASLLTPVVVFLRVSVDAMPVFLDRSFATPHYGR